MKLIVHELEAAGVAQELTHDRNVNVVAVRPHIYRHSFPAGTLKMQILTASDELVAESAEVEILDIGTETYFHGYVKFEVNAFLRKNTPYKFKLVGADGYGFSESAYIGWCNGYDLGKYAASYVTPTNLNQPLDIEVWERTNK